MGLQAPNGCSFARGTATLSSLIGVGCDTNSGNSFEGCIEVTATDRTLAKNIGDRTAARSLAQQLEAALRRGDVPAALLFERTLG